MKISDINKRIKELTKLKQLLSKSINDSDSVEEKIFKMYLKYESVSVVAKHINNLGHRIDNGNGGTRKYVANDISAIIRNKNVVLQNEDLKSIVLELFNGHKKSLGRTRW